MRGRLDWPRYRAVWSVIRDSQFDRWENERKVKKNVLQPIFLSPFVALWTRSFFYWNTDSQTREKDSDTGERVKMGKVMDVYGENSHDQRCQRSEIDVENFNDSAISFRRSFSQFYPVNWQALKNPVQNATITINSPAILASRLFRERETKKSLQT